MLQDLQRSLEAEQSRCFRPDVRAGKLLMRGSNSGLQK